MPIVIKKRVSLEFLGNDYKDSFLVFQSIPLKDFDNIIIESKKAEQENKAASYMLDILKRYFIEGEFPGVDKLVKDDLEGLDPESVIQCFSILTGQDVDPKAQAQGPSESKTASSTAVLQET